MYILTVPSILELSMDGVLPDASHLFQVFAFGFWQRQRQQGGEEKRASL